MTKHTKEIAALREEQKRLQFRLIEVEAKTKHFTPETLQDHIYYVRGKEFRDREMKVLHAEREAILEQLRRVDGELEAWRFVDSQVPTQVKKVLRKEQVHIRFGEIRKEQPRLKNTEIFDLISDELESTADAVKKAYYDRESDLKSEREEKAGKRKAGRNLDGGGRKEGKSHPDSDVPSG
jgi:hypothetical protein